MTVVSDVKTCTAGLKHAEAIFSKLALLSEDPEAKQLFHDSMMTIQEVIDQMNERIYKLENEEPQYQGF
ncbi:DUF1657 domain-containing protein [Bacillus thermotolerans]|uniref:DUF1657 domain-containing protein n=1 Tax=Bacillus thermotolerans TaxID=1221996 RepID=A0A0F5HK21_BACTR|nr:DUF1657 domain-containing protein [Bacillus thermotolerans]KKB33395.1 hypothetical protein QY97_03323 [Bacillus thermotolerans]KKB34681.1 hypothetical protein QY96_03862 [Bacillus thermotolerans]KKB36138.1 hypothetical protein QY95_03230 [Bacillus thermotolerans]